MVDQRLKNRKVADVLFRHHLRQTFQFFWSVSAFLGLIAELLADRPVERVALRAFGEVDVAKAEETIGFFFFFVERRGNALEVRSCAYYPELPAGLAILD